MKTFLSFSSHDLEFVGELHRRLKRDGVDCFFARRDIDWGENWVLALEQALDDCDSIVVVLSPDYLASKWAENELTSFIADDPGGLKYKVMPLKLRESDAPRLLKPVQIIDVSTTRLFEENYPQICEKLGGVVRQQAIPDDRTRLPEPGRLPQRTNLRYRSLGNRFVGRADDLWSLRDLLHQGRTAVVQGVGVVTGMGGLGKTQLAIEYAHRFAPLYPGGLFWVNAERGLDSLIEQIAGTAGINIDNRLPAEQQRQSLWTELSQRQATLTVLDNFPENEALEPWLPVSGAVHTLVTTRRRDLGSHLQISLDFLSETDGLELLNTGERTFGEEAYALVRSLGGLPLALELARGFLGRRSSVGIEELLVEIERRGNMALVERFADEYHDQLPSGHIREVTATFQMSWELAPAHSKKLMWILSLMEPVAVPQRLLRAIVVTHPNQGPLDDPIDLALDELDRLSLIELDDDRDPWLHRLVMGFVRETVEDETLLPARIGEAIATDLHRVCDEQDTTAIRDLEKTVPHASLFTDRVGDQTRKQMVEDLSLYHGELGANRVRKEHSESTRNRARRMIDDESLDKGDPMFVTTQLFLASSLQDAGDLEGTRDLLQTALASAEKNFDEGDFSIVAIQSHLGSVLRDLGDSEAARKLLQIALASANKSADEEHPLFSATQSHLASFLQDAGDLAGARELLQNALDSVERNPGAEESSIISIQSHLGSVLRKLGEPEAARDLLLKALAAQARIFYQGHPSIVIIQSQLASTLRDLGDVEGARELAQQVLDSMPKSRRDPKTRGVRQNLESILSG